MADIFANPDMIVTPSVNGGDAGTTSGKEYTGNQEIDSYINSLPENEREEALSVITAPETGEDINNRMKEADQNHQVYDPSYEDWKKLNQHYRTKDTDILAALSASAGEIYHTLAQPFVSLSKDHSVKNIEKIAPSVAEGSVQLLRQLYGIAAQSADSTSIQNQFFNILNGRGEDSPEAYKVFLEARKFVRESNALAEGRTSLVVNKNHLNNDFVQAAALVADPMMFIPFGKAFTLGGTMLGMSERSMSLLARTSALKNKILGGAVKYAAGMPIEFIGKGTRVTLDHAIATGEKAFVAATGVSSEMFRDGMRMSGVGSLGAGYFGHSVPLLTSASGAYVAGTAAAGVGEAVSVIGHQIMKGERGIASYARQALIDSAKQGVELSGHAKALLKIVDGFDPLIGYTTNIAAGAAHGATIGAGLGYWSGGEEGMAHGVGAGIALGSVGSTAGKLLADVSGRTALHRTSIQAKLVIEGLRDIHPEQAHNWEKAQIWAKARGFSIDPIIAAKDTLHPNTHLEIFGGNQYAEFLAENGLDPHTYDGKTFLKDGDQPLSLKSFEQQNGYVIENKANGMVKIYINADAAPRATLGHELFHSLLRTSVMKDYYAQAVKEKIIGTRDANGAVINRGIVDPKEVKQMFRRYLDAEFKDPAERADAQQRLELAEREYESSGAMVSDPSLGGRPLLEHLSEEFGAYYFSHMVMDKPPDWLYHGGDLPGIRGVLHNASSIFSNYWRSRMNLTAPEFNFSRTFIDSNGVEKLVPIDEVFAPASRDIFGNITGKTKRVVNPAMDMFFRDMLRIEKNVNETGMFDISHLNKESQVRFIEGEGLDGVFSRDISGNYKHNTEAQIARENKIRGKAVYKLLMGIPEAERTFVIDGEGNIRGHLSPQILDNIVNSGHMTRAMANKISLFQSIARGEAGGNVVDFGGVGATAERVGNVNNPSRMYGSTVPFKSRTGIVYGLETRISKNGDFQFKGNMLDYKVIEIRANNTWSDPMVQSLWNGNHTEYMADFYRYLENASKNHDDPTRKPSAELWTDGKGSERRNALHQALGLAKGEADTFINAPTAEINRNTLSSVFSFSLNRMTNLRVRKQSVPFTFENAYRDLVRNWSPREMDSELTPNGRVFKHPSGFKLFQRQDGKTDAFDELGNRIGTYETADKAAEGARKYAIKNPSTVLLKDNMQDNSVINRSPNEGQGEVPIISRSEAAEARRIGDLFRTREMQEFVGDRKLIKQTADEGYIDFIKKWDSSEPISKETALMMLDEMSKDMFGGLDRQELRLRRQELLDKNPDTKNAIKGNEWKRMSLEDGIEFKRIEAQLDKPAPQKQLHSEFTGETAKEFARKIREARKWIENALPTYNDFAGYIKDNIPLREYYQHAVYSKQFKTGEPVVVVGVHGTPNEAFLKSKKYDTRYIASSGSNSKERGKPRSDLDWIKEQEKSGLYAGLFFASSDSTALNPFYQPERGNPKIAKSAIRFDNPLVVDGQQTSIFKQTEKILGEAIEKGHDGVIYINQTDGGNLDVSFIIPAETANKQHRMIGSTREKAKAGASYEPLPRGEGVTNRTINLSPNEGEGELGTSRFNVPREEPRFRDSLGYYEQFYLPEGTYIPFDATYFESLVKGSKENPDFSIRPDPKSHNLWQFLDYHQRAKTSITVDDVLTFVKEQGRSIHPNVARDYHSKMAQVLLAFADNKQLNVPVIINAEGKAQATSKLVELSRKHQSILTREATLKERLIKIEKENLLNPTASLKRQIDELKRIIKENEKTRKKTEDDIKRSKHDEESADEGEEGNESGGKKKKVQYKHPIKILRTSGGHQQMFIDLPTLVDNVWGASTFKHKSKLYSGSERVRRMEAMMGHSFEGVALEEVAHSIIRKAQLEAVEVNPELKKFIDNTFEERLTGDAYKSGVNKLILDTETSIKNGLVVPPATLAFVKILKLHKHILENTYIKNPKGQIESLWLSKGYEINKSHHTDAGNLKSTRGNLKKGYTLIEPWDAQEKHTPITTHEYSLPQNYRETSVYRYGDVGEFIITLFNDPQHLARWVHMPVDYGLFKNLENKSTNIGLDAKRTNVRSLSKQIGEGLSQFTGRDFSVSHQLLEALIDVLDVGRQSEEDISAQDFENTKGRKKQSLPERPKGFLTPYEKAFVNDWRVNMERWSEANGKPNALEGLSDFEIWERVGEDKPPFEGSDEAMKDPALWRINAKETFGSEVSGVQIGKIKLRNKEGLVIGEGEGMVRNASTQPVKQRIGRWDEESNRWIPIDEEAPAQINPETVQDKDGNNVIVDADKNPVIDEETGRPIILDEEGNTVVIDDEGNKTPVDIPPTVPPVVPPTVPPVVPPTTPKPPVAPKPMPTRDYTQADIRAWRSWKTETYGNNSILKNGMNYVIMAMNGKFRVYNTQKALIGVYNKEEEAKRRVQREEPKR